MRGNAGANTLTGLDGNDFLIGLGGNDIIFGGTGIDSLTGGDGEDYLEGGTGADALDGGLGTDTVAYRSSIGGVTVNLTAGTASGGDAAGDTLVAGSFENIDGSDAADTLTGTAGANTINGFAGNDVIEGGAGADTLDGGAGVDTLAYRGSVAGVTIDLSTSTASGGDAAGAGGPGRDEHPAADRSGRKCFDGVFSHSKWSSHRSAGQ